MRADKENEILKADGDWIRSVLSLTESLYGRFGSRIPGTKGSIRTAGALAQFMRPYCDRVAEEAFTLYPGSLFNIGRIISVIYGLSYLFLMLGGIYSYLAFGLCVVGFVYAAVQYFMYGTLFDRLFTKKTGCNAVGILEPAGEVKRQILLVGHHDSAYIFNYLSRFGRLAGIRFLFAMLFYLLILALSAVAAVKGIFFAAVWQLNAVNMTILLAGLLFMIPLFFFISTKASPGAGDNLNGSSLALHIGRYFAERKKAGMALAGTRLILISTDGEEAGQRGAIDYARRHKAELMALPTHVLNMDSVYTLKDIAILTRDRHGFLPLSAPLAKECAQIAAELGYTIKQIAAPFGSGTDAAAFAKAGLDATALIGMPTSMFGKEYIYHTHRDTVDSIEPQAVEAIFNIAVNYIQRSDRTL